jgi:phytoene dehydrogenase-like protein
MGPWSAGSTTLLLLRAGADPHPAGSSAFPRGGMGALTAAMAAAAKQAGAEIRTGAEVKQILVKNGRVTGVALANGEEIAAKSVVSGADPRRTFLGLLDPEFCGEDAELPQQRNGSETECCAGCRTHLYGAEEFPGWEFCTGGEDSHRPGD